jgi:hypothetical protein
MASLLLKSDAMIEYYLSFYIVKVLFDYGTVRSSCAGVRSRHVTHASLSA